MSNYKNVQLIFKAIDERDHEVLYDTFMDIDPGAWYGEGSPAEEVAMAFLFVLISMKAGLPVEKWESFKELLTDRTVDMEINEMFWEDQDD